MRDAVLKTSAIGIGMLLLTTTAVAAELANGDFSDGLTSWETAGNVSVADGVARLDEPAPAEGKPGYGGLARIAQSFELPNASSLELSFRYRLVTTGVTGPALAPPDAFHVWLTDATTGQRFSFLAEGTGDIPYSQAMHYLDTDGVVAWSESAAEEQHVTALGLDAEGMMTIVVDLGELPGLQACRIEFGLACAANNRNTYVLIDDVRVTAPGLTLECPVDITVDCDDSLEPAGTGVATVTGGCTPNDPVIAYADTEYAGYWAVVDSLGPIHHWPLDEVEADGDLVDSTAEDRVGDVDGMYHDNGNSTAITPGETPAPTVSSCGCRWAVALGDQTFMEAPHDASMATSSGSVSLWLMDTTENLEWGVEDVAFLSKSTWERAAGQFVLYTHSDQGSGPYIEAIMTDASLADHSVTSLDLPNEVGEPTFDLFNWHHIVFTFGSGGMKLYMDGVEVGANSFTGGASANDESLLVGHGMWCSPPAPCGSFDYSFLSGKIDEVMWFNRALSANEVATLYAASGCRQILRTWTALDEDCDPDQSDSCQQVITVSPQE